MLQQYLIKLLELPNFYIAERLLVSLLLSGLIGAERERNDKPAGIRTIMMICLGATLIVILTLEFNKMYDNFDMMRPLAYYLVGWGFLGGNIINRIGRSKLEGITTASLLLPLSVIGFFCGIGEIVLACIGTLLIYFILNIKYIQIKFNEMKGI